VWIFGFDPLNQFAFFGMPGNDRVGTIRSLAHRPFRKIKAEASFAHLRVWAVTTETTAGEDWLHILIEIEAARWGAMTAEKRAHDKCGQQRKKGQPCMLVRPRCLGYMICLHGQTALRLLAAHCILLLILTMSRRQ
jgi:hypothetical protein